MAPPSNLFIPRQATSISFVTATQTQTIQPPAPTFNASTVTLVLSQYPTTAPDPSQIPYRVLNDGSLVTNSFINDFAADKARLVVLGLLLMLFSRNVAASISYLFRVKLKSKLLFYFLLSSQICGFLAMSALLAPFFIQAASCHAVNLIASILVQISYTFLIPGILAVKAFRCLDRARFILIVVITLHTASVGLFLSDLPNLHSISSITGSCTARGDLSRIVIAIFLLLAEIIFICLCFLYAVWRATRYPEARGRVSIQMSINRVISGVVDPVLQNNEKGNTLSRGWWDYNNNNNTTNNDNASQISHTKSGTPPRGDRPGVLQAFVMRLFGDDELVDQPYLQRKPSVHSTKPLTQTNKKDRRMSWKNWSRMLKFPSALKTELGYTCVIALTCAMAAGLIVAGAFDYRLFGGPAMWGGLSWGLTSLLIMRNFSRLVRRNERESTLQEPAAWNPLLQSQSDQNNAASYLRRNLGISAISSTTSAILGPSSRSRATRAADTDQPMDTDPQVVEDPFADFEPVRKQRESWRSPSQFENPARRMTRGTERSSVSRYSSRSSIVQLLPVDAVTTLSPTDEAMPSRRS